MTFAEKIYTHIRKANVLEIGEIKTYQAYLYSEKYEIVINALPNRKVLTLTIAALKDRVIVFNETGTLSHLLNVATGYARHH